MYKHTYQNSNNQADHTVSQIVTSKVYPTKYDVYHRKNNDVFGHLCFLQYWACLPSSDEKYFKKVYRNTPAYIESPLGIEYDPSLLLKYDGLKGNPSTGLGLDRLIEYFRN